MWLLFPSGQHYCHSQVQSDQSTPHPQVCQYPKFLNMYKKRILQSTQSNYVSLYILSYVPWRYCTKFFFFILRQLYITNMTLNYSWLLLMVPHYRGIFVYNICLISIISASVSDQATKLSIMNIERIPHN